MTINTRLVLGTAQLGMQYGIANTSGQPSFDTAREILRTAWNSGIEELDTAQAYGQSEKSIGVIVDNLNISDRVKITTKLHPTVNHLDRKEMTKSLLESMERLHVPKLYCLMLHREDMLDLWDSGLHDILESFIQKGMIRHIGISVYAPHRAIQAIHTNGIDFVQLPTNIIDRRFEKSGVFELAIEMNKQIYIRSVFLQGLLLMNPDALSPQMNFAKPVLEELRSVARKTNLSIRLLALGYVKSVQPKAKLIIAVERADQLNEIIDDLNISLPLEAIQEISEKFYDIDEKLINPALWKR